MRYDIPSFRIDKRDFLKGNNLYDDYPDGGFLSSSIGVNGFYKPGLISAPPVIGSTVTGSLPSGGAIAWSLPNGSAPPAAVMVDGSGNGSYWQMDIAGNYTQKATTDTGNTYTAGVTDCCLFNNQYYTTTTTNITLTDTGTFLDKTWWTVTKGKAALSSGVPHPMCVVGAVMYIADGRYLHSYDGTTITLQAFDVGNSMVITALCYYNGYLYIAAQPYFSSGYHGRGTLIAWDAFSKGWQDQVDTDYNITCLFVYKNIMYMFNQYNVSYFFRRRFHVVHPLSGLVYKHQVTTVSDSMMYSDGRYIWRYGSPFAETIAQEKWYRYLKSTTNNFAGILGWYQNGLNMTEVGGGNASNYNISDVNVPGSTSTLTVDFNPKFFPYSVRVRGVFIDGTPLAAGQRLQVKWTDSNGNLQAPSQLDFNSSNAAFLNKRQKRMDVNGTPATRVIQPQVTITGAYSLRYMDFLYERSEDQLDS